MQYPVIIEQLNGHYRATVPALMGLMAEGTTRDEALRNVWRAAAVYLSKIEIATIEVATPFLMFRADSPQAWLQSAGKFAGEEEAMQQHIEEIYAARRQEREEAEREQAELAETK